MNRSDDEETITTNIADLVTHNLESLQLKVPENMLSLQEALECSTQSWSIRTLKFFGTKDEMYPAPPTEKVALLENLKNFKISGYTGPLSKPQLFDSFWQGLRGSKILLRKLDVVADYITRDFLDYLKSDSGRSVSSLIIRSGSVAPEIAELFPSALEEIRYSLVNLKLESIPEITELVSAPGSSPLDIEFPQLATCCFRYVNNHDEEQDDQETDGEESTDEERDDQETDSEESTDGEQDEQESNGTESTDEGQDDQKSDGTESTDEEIIVEEYFKLQKVFAFITRQKSLKSINVVYRTSRYLEVPVMENYILSRRSKQPLKPGVEFRIKSKIKKDND